MKKLFFIALVLFFNLTMLKAQINSDSNGERYYYCELVGTQKFLSPKVVVSIDFGEERKFFADQRVRDEQTGKVTKFNSMVDALNYMGSDGWEFVQAYIVTIQNQNVYHWLLKKKFTVSESED